MRVVSLHPELFHEVPAWSALHRHLLLQRVGWWRDVELREGIKSFGERERNCFVCRWMERGTCNVSIVV